MADTTIPAPPAKGALGLIRHGWHRARTSLRWMVVVAFMFRLGLIVIGHTYRFRPDDNHFSFGWEMGSIGRSLALGQGFSNPFGEPTGSTAWEPPLYPFLIAAVFRLFGVYTAGSAVVLLAINSIFSSLTCIPIFLIANDRSAKASRCGAHGSGRWRHSSCTGVRAGFGRPVWQHSCSP